MKTIPKSLHTITVLVAVARQRMDDAGVHHVAAIDYALALLGYIDDMGRAPDTYELAAKARAILAKSVQS